MQLPRLSCPPRGQPADAPTAPTGKPDKYLEYLYNALELYQSNIAFGGNNWECPDGASCSKPQLLPTGAKTRNVTQL